MLKEIGSDFWLDTDVNNNLCFNPINLNKYGISGKDVVFLSSGRAAILYAIKDIKKIKRKKNLIAIIPSFTCETVLNPFLNENIETYVYDINENLEIDLMKLSNQINLINPDIVLIHRYYGFETVKGINSIIQKYKNSECVFIEDRTQCLFSNIISLDVDYIIGSFRKWAALPDGGFCIKINDSFSFDNIPQYSDDYLVEKKMKAFQQKKQYMINDIGEKKIFLNSYRMAEAILDEERDFFSMSDVSKNILEAWDIKNLREKRRNNYSYVYSKIKCNSHIKCITKELIDSVVPLYLVIRSQRRNELQIILRNNDIFAPIVWPKPDRIPTVSKIVDEIYNEVLCLPIDQRYGIDDMKRMVEIVKEF